ncbi:unnamed protein product [Ilex paraguariensis]|uniref:Uncharacterized protein n=1 Tax=Ilex paraguariensis TaxID=185542 RepID=A0ABC8RWU4_9AQUA
MGAAGLSLGTEREFSSSGGDKNEEEDGEQSGPSIHISNRAFQASKVISILRQIRTLDSAIRLIWSFDAAKTISSRKPKEPEGEVSENSEKLESEDDDTHNGDAEDEDMRTVMAFK